MGIILGTTTTVIVGGVTDGFQSVNWNLNQQPNRMWQLGSWVPYNTQVAATVTVSVTAYAGNNIGPIALEPALGCVDSTAIRDVVINASACTDPVSFNFSRMFVTSYSYSKGDPIGFGTESWSFQAWIDSDVAGDGGSYGPFVESPLPTVVLQGISEGSMSGDVPNLGVIMHGVGQVSGYQGSVSAGPTSVGNSDEVIYGIVTSIGGGDLVAFGRTGQSSASIPHQPLYF